MVNVIFPENNSTVPVLSTFQKDFIRLGGMKKSENVSNIIDWLNLVRESKEDNTFPRKLVIEYMSDEDNPELFLSENENLTDLLDYESENGKFIVDNLKIGVKYYYRIGNSKTFCFTTEDYYPRHIRIEGLTNVRDTGGWKTTEGKKIKQGLIYRGCELDTHLNITEKGKNTFVNGLKIKTELDMREEAVGKLTESPAGKGLNYIQIPTHPYYGFLEDQYAKDTVLKLFETFADDTLYPIYYHCWGGADRTGTLAFFLGAILGMSYEDLLLDYEVTCLSIWGERSRNTDYMKEFLRQFDKLNSSDKPYNKAVTFLEKYGVTDSIINKIRKNLLE